MPLTATAHATASCRDGRTYLRELRSEPPLSLRSTVDGLVVVASAFGPLGGDRTELKVDLDAGARLWVGSAGAAVAQPGPSDPISRASVRLRVAAGADLQWCPKPLVVSAGAEHHGELDLVVAAGARVLLSELVVLAGGRYRSHWRVEHDGAPLLAADLDVGTGAPEGWDGPAGTGGHPILVTALAIGSDVPAGPFFGGEVLALAGPAVVLILLSDDAVAAQAALDAFAGAARTGASPSAGPSPDGRLQERHRPAP